jgi:hypothetical protein
MPNTEKITKKKKAIDEASGTIHEQLKEYRKQLDRTMDDFKPEVQKEIDKLQRELDIHEGQSKVLGELLELGKGEYKIRMPEQEHNDRELVYVNNAYESAVKDIGQVQDERSSLLSVGIKENIVRSKQSNAATDDFLESFRTNKWASATFRFLQIGGIIMAASSLALAVTNYLRNQPKPPEKPKNVPGPLPVGGGSSDKGMNWGALGAAQAGASSSEAPPELSEDQIEDLMLGLFVNKGVIAAGKVPQDSLWQNLASQADGGDLEAHNLTLMFIQEAAVDLPGTRDFFWGAPSSDMAERYQALRQAYKRSGKLSDVYLEATKLEYNGEKIPTFHVALLLQLALRLIKHDLLYPNATPI